MTEFTDLHAAIEADAMRVTAPGSFLRPERTFLIPFSAINGTAPDQAARAVAICAQQADDLRRRVLSATASVASTAEDVTRTILGGYKPNSLGAFQGTAAMADAAIGAYAAGLEILAVVAANTDLDTYLVVGE